MDNFPRRLGAPDIVFIPRFGREISAGNRTQSADESGPADLDSIQRLHCLTNRR